VKPLTFEEEELDVGQMRVWLRICCLGEGWGPRFLLRGEVGSRLFAGVHTVPLVEKACPSSFNGASKFKISGLKWLKWVFGVI
jgi:hypothetical protein